LSQVEHSIPLEWPAWQANRDDATVHWFTYHLRQDMRT
jgi:hypothetical protein